MTDRVGIALTACIVVAVVGVVVAIARRVETGGRRMMNAPPNDPYRPLIGRPTGARHPLIPYRQSSSPFPEASHTSNSSPSADPTSIDFGGSADPHVGGGHS